MTENNTTKMIFTVGNMLTILGCIIKLFDIAYAPYVFSAGVAFPGLCSTETRCR
ncbi:MAG: hypothetical protein QM800_15305 [Paludibacter sp.]